MGTWLICKAAKGMFPGELAVLVPTAEGGSLSLFLPREVVHLTGRAVNEELNGEEVDAKIRVDLLERDDRFGLVALPGQPLDGPRVAKVPNDRLAL